MERDVLLWDDVYSNGYNNLQDAITESKESPRANQIDVRLQSGEILTLERDDQDGRWYLRGIQ